MEESSTGTKRKLVAKTRDTKKGKIIWVAKKDSV